MNKTSYTPCIVRETCDGLTRYPIVDERLQHREIYCVGDIDRDSAHAVILQLLHLQQTDPDGEITLYINSPGGEVSSGLAIYDTMAAITCPIRTVCVGLAASMGALLFAAGDRRDILPHGRVMIHDPALSSGAGGSALALERTSKNLMKTRKTTAEILARHTGHSLKEIYRKTAADTYFNAQEAVAFGLADRIIDKL